MPPDDEDFDLDAALAKANEVAAPVADKAKGAAASAVDAVEDFDLDAALAKAKNLIDPTSNKMGGHGQYVPMDAEGRPIQPAWYDSIFAPPPTADQWQERVKQTEADGQRLRDEYNQVTSSPWETAKFLERSLVGLGGQYAAGALGALAPEAEAIASYTRPAATAAARTGTGALGRAVDTVKGAVQAGANKVVDTAVKHPEATARLANTAASTAAGALEGGTSAFAQGGDVGEGVASGATPAALLTGGAELLGGTAGALGRKAKRAANIKLADRALPARDEVTLAAEGGEGALAQAGQDLRDLGITKARNLLDYFRPVSAQRMSRNAQDALHTAGRQVQSAEANLLNTVTPEGHYFHEDPFDVDAIRNRVESRAQELESANMPESHIAGVRNAQRMLTPDARANAPVDVSYEYTTPATPPPIPQRGPAQGTLPGVSMTPNPQMSFDYAALDQLPSRAPDPAPRLYSEGVQETLPGVSMGQSAPQQSFDYAAMSQLPETVSPAPAPPPPAPAAPLPTEQMSLPYPERQASLPLDERGQQGLPFPATVTPEVAPPGPPRRAQPYPFPDEGQLSLTDLTPRSEAQVARGQRATLDQPQVQANADILRTVGAGDAVPAFYSNVLDELGPYRQTPVSRPELRQFTEAPAVPAPPPSPEPQQLSLESVATNYQPKLLEETVYSSGQATPPGVAPVGRGGALDAELGAPPVGDQLGFGYQEQMFPQGAPANMTPNVDPNLTQGPMLPSERGTNTALDQQQGFGFQELLNPAPMTPHATFPAPAGPPDRTVRGTTQAFPGAAGPDGPSNHLTWGQGVNIKREHQNAMRHNQRDLNTPDEQGFAEGRRLVVDELRPDLAEHAQKAAAAGRVAQQDVDDLLGGNRNFTRAADVAYNLAQQARSERVTPKKTGVVSGTLGALGGVNSQYRAGQALEGAGMVGDAASELSRAAAGLGWLNQSNKHPEMQKVVQQNPGAPKATVEAKTNENMKESILDSWYNGLLKFGSKFAQ